MLIPPKQLLAKLYFYDHVIERLVLFHHDDSKADAAAPSPQRPTPLLAGIDGIIFHSQTSYQRSILLILNMPSLTKIVAIAAVGAMSADAFVGTFDGD